MKVDTALLRQFIIEKFSADELSVFLFDYFRPVYNDMTSTIRNKQRVQILLEYCVNHDQYLELFAVLERERPGIFQQRDFTDALLLRCGLPRWLWPCVHTVPLFLFGF
ncbi:MAG: hypothetical protein DWQ04_18495 [Chloroflexi bacterium]|nr:MAG: hypothetical protein DWQ04_18495 [Chloroflexota bacterium]